MVRPARRCSQDYNGFDLGAARLVAEATYQWSISDTRSGGIVLLIFWTLLIERLIGPLLSTVSSIQGSRIRLIRTPSGPATPKQGWAARNNDSGAYDYGVEDRGLFLVVSSVGAPVFEILLGMFAFLVQTQSLLV